MESLALFDIRQAIDFPEGEPGNDTDTIIAGFHFNTSTLEHFNYTLYENNTISNRSRCYLAFAPYNPVYVFPNGTFQNTTSCYSAVNPIGSRGYAAIGLAAAFGLGLVFSLTALTKHGRLYIPSDRRFYPIGRRWQYYWALFVCGFALISLFTHIDIDRYYIQEIPIILSSATWFIMCQGTIALVWEATRHWGSWQERQYVDPNPFIYHLDDRRAKTEFWLPLWAYLWIWMNFFLTIPRSWNFTKLQRSPELIRDVFIPNATSIRFSVGGFCFVIAWVTMLFSLWHSIRYYKARNRGIFNRIGGFLSAVPSRILLLATLSAILIAYQIYMSFVWQVSVMRLGGSTPVIFCLGYGPSLLIVWIQVFYAYFAPNEDKELLRQRAARGEHINAELGIVKKPAWWKRRREQENTHEAIFRNVREVGGRRGIGRRAEGDFERHIREDALDRVVNDGGDIELEQLGPNNPRVDRAGVKNKARVNLAGVRDNGFGVQYAAPSASTAATPQSDSAWSPMTPASPNEQDYLTRGRRPGSGHSNPPPPYTDPDAATRPPGTGDQAQRSNSTSTLNSINGPAQQIRSMLDV